MPPTLPPSPNATSRPLSAVESSISASRKSYALGQPPAILERYDTATMLLHWTVALLLLLVALSSLFIEETRADALSGMLRMFHYVAGTLVFVLVLAWFAWRATREELPDISSIGSTERRIAEGMNGAIKILLVLVPLTGIFYAFSKGGQINLGFTTFAFDLSLREQNIVRLGLTHNLLGKALLGFALLHSLYSLYHHFKLRDTLLRRMLPWH